MVEEAGIWETCCIESGIRATIEGAGIWDTWFIESGIRATADGRDLFTVEIA